LVRQSNFVLLLCSCDPVYAGFHRFPYDPMPHPVGGPTAGPPSSSAPLDSVSIRRPHPIHRLPDVPSPSCRHRTLILSCPASTATAMGIGENRGGGSKSARSPFTPLAPAPPPPLPPASAIYRPPRTSAPSLRTPSPDVTPLPGSTPPPSQMGPGPAAVPHGPIVRHPDLRHPSPHLSALPSSTSSMSAALPTCFSLAIIQVDNEP